MRAPITVSILDGVSLSTVTSAVAGLRFRKTAPGGHADASFTLNLPANTFADLGPADRVWFYNGITGKTLWEGYTNNPGTQSGRTGEGFELSALGGMSLASDRSERLIYVDQTLDWAQDTTRPQVASATGAPGNLPEGSGANEGAPAVMAQFNPGQPITTGSQVGVRYSKFEGSPMVLGAFAGIYDAGRTDAAMALEWCGHGASSIIESIGMSGSASSIVRYRESDFAGRDYTSLTFRLARISGGATNVSTSADDFWAGYASVNLFGLLNDRYGNARSMAPRLHAAAGSGLYCLIASDVVEDLLGRILTFCDPTTATIDTTSYLIDQLAYPDTTTAASLLDDLSLFEPDFHWGIGASNAAGQHDFWYRAWPTTPRYVIPASMTVERPGSDFDLCNRIAVNWTDVKGNAQVTVITSTVPALGSRFRDAEPITLPEGRSHPFNAARIGQQVLASKAHPPKAAKVLVDRPILDLLRGCMVYPWEIEPGYLARDVATGDDLRLTEMSYEDDSQTAELTLGEPVLTIEQRIARLSKVTK